MRDLPLLADAVAKGWTGGGAASVDGAGTGAGAGAGAGVAGMGIALGASESAGPGAMAGGGRAEASGESCDNVSAPGMSGVALIGTGADGRGTRSSPAAAASEIASGGKSALGARGMSIEVRPRHPAESDRGLEAAKQTEHSPSFWAVLLVQERGDE